jgi:hypothetical protein
MLAFSHLALTYFGGCPDLHSTNLIIRLVSRTVKRYLEKEGIDTSKHYDTRDFAAIEHAQ